MKGIAVWKRIDEFPDYVVNEKGRVRHEGSDRPLKPQINPSGVPYVGLMQGTEQKKRSLARLVAKHFIPEDREAFDTPINLNGDRLDCSVDNLMWRPRWFAIKYHNQFDAPYLNHIARLVRARGEEEVYSSSLDAAIRYGLLEHDLVYGILKSNPVWPTYRFFELVE